MPPAQSAEVLLPCGNILGETAMWIAREQALYWVDIRAPALHRVDPATSEHRRWPMPELCYAAALGEDGVIVAFPRDLARFDPASATLSRLVEIEPESFGNPLNEAKCVRWGRLWIGSMRDFDTATTGSLSRIGPDLRSARVLTNITVPISLGWSPDRRTMYFADTPTRILGAYDFEPETGGLGPARPLLPPDELPGRPDGCTVDVQGHVWNARFGAGCVARISPQGRVSALVHISATQPASPLGGHDMRTLFIKAATQRLDPAQRRKQPQAGHLFAIDVDVPGLSDVPFVIESRR